MMQVDTAYATCVAITRREARNFSYGIMLLGPQQRRAMSAIYATCRRIDDIGDTDGPATERTGKLTWTRAQLHGLSDVGDDPVLVALRDAAHRFPVPMEAFDDLIDGCQSDVDGRRYASFEDVVGYCRQVAGSVGRLSVGVYRPVATARAMPLADSLGVALQLTNILRDLREDRSIGRVYLPSEDLDRFGCTLDLDPAGRIADPAGGFTALVRFEARRAQLWYDRGLALLPLLDRRSAACTAAMAGIYRRLLHTIQADPDLVRTRRVSLSTRSKAGAVQCALTGRRP